MQERKRQGRISVAGTRPALVLATFLILSGTDTAYSLLRSPAVGGSAVAQQAEPSQETEAARETPGYGVSGYFSLEGEGGSAIRVAPRSPTGRTELDIRIEGGRLRVISPQAQGGLLALRLIDARGRVLRAWNEILPQGGAAVLALDGKARGILILQVDGGVLGRAVKILPPLRTDAW